MNRYITGNLIASILVLCVAAGMGSTVAAAQEVLFFKFDFGSGETAEGYTQLLPEMTYSNDRGYGFEPGAVVEAVDRGGVDQPRTDFCTSETPFLFSVKVPEGNYRVTVILGDKSGESATTIKAELRRLMLENVKTRPGQFVEQAFVVNVRTPAIPGGGEVRLKDREKTSEWRAWDDKLTLEFNGSHPCVCAVEIARVDDISTVYILGDSTVCDQPREPWNSWGQMFTRFFRPRVAIANHAESGESIRSSISAGRLEKVYSLMKPGDYVLAQFGHNDMKSRAPDAINIYKADLKAFVAEVRRRGGTPVLITSMERKGGVNRDTLGDYPVKVREVAAEDDVALIDLHAMSKVLYKALGDDLDKAFQDGTHHNNYGSYQLAQCVVEGIKAARLDLANHIVDDFYGYDSSEPDPVDGFQLPASPMSTAWAPEGN